MSTKSVRGFSLIELVIVIAVIAILAALLAPTILGQAERARQSRARNDVAEFGKMVARIRTETGSSTAACLTNIYVIPTNTSGSFSTTATCGTLVPSCENNPNGYSCWGGPYLVVTQNDPWNNAYSATMDPVLYSITIVSNGPDGTYNTTDDITFVQ